MINRKFFFDQCRRTLFTGKLNKGQVDGLTFILDVWEAAHSKKDERWLAYAFATAYHETAFTMQPIRERGGPNYFTRMYDPKSTVPRRAALAKKMGAQPGDGPIFYGRGYVQLTWRVNYAKMGKAFQVDLIADAAAADKVLQPELAAKIMFKGMEEGTFTGRKFAGYFNSRTEDWKNARQIINGNDCDEAIAVYAKKFYAAISHVPRS
jgi:putative chitinase